MKKSSKKSKIITEFDVYSNWDESNIEYVSSRDEEETLQSLGVFKNQRKSYYNHDHDDYFGVRND